MDKLRSPYDFAILYRDQALTYADLKGIGYGAIAKRRAEEKSDARHASLQCAVLFGGAMIIGSIAAYRYFSSNARDVFWQSVAPVATIIGATVGIKRGMDGQHALGDALLLDKACVMIKRDSASAEWDETVYDLEQTGFLRKGSYEAYKHRVV